MTAPFLLRPTCKDYLWGGTRLREQYHKESEQELIAETWELSCHPDGPCTIASGPETGRTLAEYLAANPQAAGSRAAGFEAFPLLIKLIDAKGDLSVQVHPDDSYACRVEGGYGKTEMWYILDCEPGASLYYGFEHDVSARQVREAISAGTVAQLLHRVAVRPGDLFFIEAGTVHAIGAGITLAEVQQNSNTTYRVYDYGRRDKNGNLRELHIEKALEVMQLGPARNLPPADWQNEGTYRLRPLASCRYFTVDVLALSGRAVFASTAESFVGLLCTEGTATLVCQGENLTLHRGDSAFVPAGLGDFTLEGHCTLVRTRL